MKTLSITRPDDWHVHLRDGEALAHTVTATANHFSRALVMPNLTPALTTLAAVSDYRERLIMNLATNHSFTPYMTLYLTDHTKPDELQNMKHHPYILGAKYYPAGATTNSEEGARSILTLYPLFEIMQENNLVLQIHAEVTYGDIFAREALFIEQKLIPLIHNFPKLRIVVEHISSKAGVDFVTQASDYVAATITPHHLVYNRNDMLVGGIKPHYYCLPILKRRHDQIALQQAATSGNRKFFAGTDSAPHTQSRKENSCGCAGIFSAPYALAMYTQLFDTLDKLDKLDAFMGHFGANFYQLPISQNRIELVKQQQIVPHGLPFGNDHVIPIAAGQTLEWSVHEPE